MAVLQRDWQGQDVGLGSLSAWEIASPEFAPLKPVPVEGWIAGSWALLVHGRARPVLPPQCPTCRRGQGALQACLVGAGRVAGGLPDG